MTTAKKRVRNSGDPCSASDRPLKKRCLVFFDGDEVDRLRGEIASIKKGIRNVDILLDELLRVYDDQQVS